MTSPGKKKCIASYQHPDSMRLSYERWNNLYFFQIECFLNVDIFASGTYSGLDLSWALITSVDVQNKKVPRTHQSLVSNKDDKIFSIFSSRLVLTISYFVLGSFAFVGSSHK